MAKALFITLEGGDGAGKSTQIENIKKYFEEKGKECVITREPGGTPVGEKLREVLLDCSNGEMEDVTEMMIFAASRAQHVRELIRPSLADGKIVICDRFKDSSLAYQGIGRDLGDMVENVNNIAVDGLVPDITFWLDVDPETGKARASNAGELDRLEREKMDFHQKVYEGYLKLCRENPERIKRIDATKPIEEIKEDIYAELDKLVNC
ncbi:MAG: dTMP kinase [Clostridiales bacterium]|nr:dTMP kinase [Candidatus Crickella caballi]